MQLFEIYHHHGEDFYRFALSLTNHKEQAEDLVQQAYLKALEQMELFENIHREQTKGWFFTVIKNKFIDQQRRSKKRQMVTFDEKELGNLLEPYLNPSIEDSVIGKIQVKEILDHLPKDLKPLVTYRYILGYNSREMAETLGINPSTLRSRLGKAQRILQGQMEL